MKVLLSRLITILIPFQLVLQPVVTYAQVPSTYIDESQPIPQPTMTMQALSRITGQWFSQNRTTSEKVYPFRNPYLFKTFDEVDQYLKTDKFRGEYGFRILERDNVASIYHKDRPYEVVAEFQLATRQELVLYSPRNMKKRLQEMAHAARDTSAKGKVAFKQALLNLPMEAAIFYMAMGAVAAINLTANFGSNPAGMKINHQEQTSALGITALGLFLTTQAGASAVLTTVLKNPNWHTAVPYLAMMFAMTAQNYAIGLATDPNIRACAKEMMGQPEKVPGAYEDPCEKAYEYATVQKPWEFAPALTSMLITTALQTGAQFAVSGAASRAESAIGRKAVGQTVKGKMIRSGLLRFAGFMNPAGFPAFAAAGVWMYLTKASHLTSFVLIDQKISHNLIFGMKNMQENFSVPFLKSLRKSSEMLSQKIVEEKAQAWEIQRTVENCKVNRHADCSGLYEELNRMSDQMKMWRMANMEDVMKTHQSWQTYLNDVVGRYKAAETFYARYVDMNHHFLTGSREEMKLLNRPFPFLGVKVDTSKPDGIQAMDEVYSTDPYLVESEQLALVQQFQAKMLQVIAEFENKKIHLLQPDRNLFNELKNLFIGNKGESDSEKLKLGQGLITVRKYLVAQTNLGNVRETVFMKVRDAFVEIGSPNPTLIPGQGVIRALQYSPSLQQLYKPLTIPKTTLISQPQNLNDYFIQMMICGPDISKGEKLLQQYQGFYVDFKPPAITPAKTDLKNYSLLCHNMGMGHPDLFYNTPVVGPYRHSPTQKVATYKSPFEYLKFNVDVRLDSKSVVKNSDLSPENFREWWKTRTEEQMSQAFADFQSKYNANIALLIDRLHRKENSTWNFNDSVSNGLLANIQQELRVNLLILGEMLKDIHLNKNKKVLPEHLLEAQQVYPTTANSEDKTKYPEILKVQARASYMDFNSIAQQYPAIPYRLPESQTPYRLKIQTKIERVFDSMTAKLKQIRARQVDGKTIIDGQIDNFDLEKAVSEVEELTTLFADYMGIKAKSEGPEAQEPSKNPDANLIQLSPETSKIATKCLENIQALSYEVMSYGLIINAVSWSNLQKVKESSEAQKEAMKKVGEMIETARPAMKMGR